jgi:hypothetical protein
VHAVPEIMNLFVYFSTILFTFALAEHAGLPTLLGYAVNTASDGLYGFLLASTVILLLVGALSTVFGLKRHKRKVRRNGEAILISGMILWSFVGLGVSGY